MDKLTTMSKSELEALFPKLDVSHIPNLSNYSWEEWHEGSLGAGDCFLADEMAQKLDLQPGMRILDIGSGRGYNSCFLAKHYGVIIYAVDAFANPTDVVDVAAKKGVSDNVIPIRADAKNMPFADDFFDAALSLNAFFYFGTDDTYLPYLSRFLKPSALLCVASPCFAKEPDEETPTRFMFDSPDYIEFYSIHSPQWWKQHFAKYRDISLLSCEEHPLGREIWLDSLRWQMQTRPLADISNDMSMLIKDTERFVSYFSLLAKF